MVKKAKQTAKKTTTKKDNKKCPTSTKVAIIAVIAAVAVLAAVLIFVMFFKGKKQILSCDLIHEENYTNVHAEYAYNLDTSKPFNVYQLFEAKAADEQEAAENAELLNNGSKDDADYFTTKAWSEGDKFYVETNSDEQQIKLALEDEEMEFLSLSDSKADMESMGFVCEIKK